MIDIALALHRLVPNALYSGALEANSEEQYQALRWTDERPQPPFEDVVALCNTSEFQAWVKRFFAPAKSRSEISLSLRSQGAFSRTEALEAASGMLPSRIADSIYAAVDRGELSEERAFAAEMAWAGSSTLSRLDDCLDVLSVFAYVEPDMIDNAFEIASAALEPTE